MIPVHAFKNRVSGFGLSFISMLNGLKHKEIMHMFKGEKKQFANEYTCWTAKINLLNARKTCGFINYKIQSFKN